MRSYLGMPAGVWRPTSPRASPLLAGLASPRAAKSGGSLRRGVSELDPSAILSAIGAARGDNCNCWWRVWFDVSISRHRLNGGAAQAGSWLQHM